MEVDNFWTLLKDGIILQGLITLLLVITMCVIWLQGMMPPTGLLQLVSITVAFYFGTKLQYDNNKTVSTANQLIDKVKEVDVVTKDGK